MHMLCFATALIQIKATKMTSATASINTTLTPNRTGEKCCVLTVSIFNTLIHTKY